MSITRFGDGTPISSKGDIVTHDGTTATSFPVGTDGQILTAQSSAPSGLVWANLNTGSTQYYKLIESKFLTAAANSVTFSSIPSTYDQLSLVVLQKRADSTSVVTSNIRFNSDTTSNYRVTERSNFSAVAQSTTSSATSVKYKLDGTHPTTMEMIIPRYNSTTINKPFKIEYSYVSATTEATMVLSYVFGNYADAATAINSITIYAGSIGGAETFSSGSDYFFSLYGVNWS
jgi:hypothetical protein